MLSGLQTKDLHRVRIPCRCHGGFVVHETRCRSCATALVLNRDASGNVIAGTRNAEIRALDRAAAVSAYERHFERDR